MSRTWSVRRAPCSNARSPSGVYHCVNSGWTTWSGLARELAAIVGKPDATIVDVKMSEANLAAPRPKFAALTTPNSPAPASRCPPGRMRCDDTSPRSKPLAKSERSELRSSNFEVRCSVQASDVFPNREARRQSRRVDAGGMDEIRARARRAGSGNRRTVRMADGVWRECPSRRAAGRRSSRSAAARASVRGTRSSGTRSRS